MTSRAPRNAAPGDALQEVKREIAIRDAQLLQLLDENLELRDRNSQLKHDEEAILRTAKRMFEQEKSRADAATAEAAKLRGLLGEAIDEVETRDHIGPCSCCGGMSAHDDGCLVSRIRSALAETQAAPGEGKKL